MCALTALENGDIEVQERIKEYNAAIYARVGQFDVTIRSEDEASEDEGDYDSTRPMELPTVEGDESDPEGDYVMDLMLNAEVLLPKGDKQELATVVSHKRDVNGWPIGHYNANPLLDSREYAVKFRDGSEDTYNMNILVDALYSQVDNDGNQFYIFRDLVGHRAKQGVAITKDNMFIGQGSRRMKRSTRG